jgi:hypothetical protein
VTPFAHAGGWDEILFTLLPAAVFFFVLQISRKRREAREAAERAASEGSEDPPSSVDSQPS